MKQTLAIFIIGLAISCNANAWFFFWANPSQGGEASSTSPIAPSTNISNGGKCQLQIGSVCFPQLSLNAGTN